MVKIIALDMDGTIADFYSVPDWLDKIRAEDTSPYAEAAPLVDMKELAAILTLLQKAGYEIQIITAPSKTATPEYKKRTWQVKKEWLQKYGVPYDRFHGIDWATNKTEAIRRQMGISPAVLQEIRHLYPNLSFSEAILVDDEPARRDAWKWGDTIDPTEVDIIEALSALLPEDI